MNHACNSSVQVITVHYWTVYVNKVCVCNIWCCSETTPTGESQFHKSTPLGIEPGSLMTGSKGLTHWTSETVCQCSEIAGSPQGSPPAAEYVCSEARRRTCSERENGTEELYEVKWDYHIVRTTAYWRFGTKHTSDEATLINHVGVTNVARQR